MYAKLWDMSFVTLVIQNGALAKLYNMGENRRKTLSTTLHTSWDRGCVNPIFSKHIAKDAS